MNLVYLPVFAGCMLCTPVIALSQQPSPADTDTVQAVKHASASEMERWRRATSAAPPNQPGCYRIHYPAEHWQKIDCGPPPIDPPRTPRSFPPTRQGLRPNAPALQGDYIMTPINKITSATGRIIALNQVTSVGSINANNNTYTSNLFSIQLNSNNNFPANTGTPSCKLSTNTNCRGWIQFVYNNSQQLYIQYWFQNYLSSTAQSCPSSLPLTAKSVPLDCAQNAVLATLASAPADFTKMQGVSLTGLALSNGTVAAILSAGGTSYTVTGVDQVDAASSWTSAEFNVFGSGGSSSGIFNVVQLNTAAQVTMGLTSNNDNSLQLPDCQAGTTTAESSNMFLGPCNKTTAPGIYFNESPANGCDFSESCLVFDNQPPSYMATCSSPSDFYTTSDIQAPADFQLIAHATTTNSGSTTDEAVTLAACQLGSKTQCDFYSIYTSSAQSCHKRGGSGGAGGGGGDECTKCGGRKCCPNPDGGQGTICVPTTQRCPVIH